MRSRSLSALSAGLRRSCSPTSRYLQLAGGRERVAALLERQTSEAGGMLDADAALELANSELHEMRRQRRAARQ